MLMQLFRTLSARHLFGRGGPSAAVLVSLALFSTACTSGTASDVTQTTVSSTTATTAAMGTTTDQVEQDPEPGSERNLLRVDTDLEGALLGISTGLSKAERAPRFRAVENDADRRYDIGHVFHAWDKAIPTVDDLMHLDEDRILMISWNGTDTREIASGQHDEWIRSQAAAVRDLEEPLLLRWLWEMDGNRRRTWVHSGPDYVTAWLHVRNLFDEVGADNAQFVWCPNESLFADGGDPDAWYPGDDKVDWLCADGYNWGTSIDSLEWLAMDIIFADFIEWAAPHNLPIMIGETGAAEAELGAKAAWLREIPEILRSELSDVDAIVYFDKDFTGAGHQDWRVDTSDETYAAWLEISADPWLNPFDR
jgi:hypothetical protein